MLVGLLAVWDMRMRQAPHLGFAPSEAQWLAFAPDFPAFSAALQTSDPVQRVLSKIPAGETSMASVAGWTRFWIGGPILFSEGAGSWGCCLRPGAALRITCWLKEKTGRPALFGRLHYCWRDGFLLASESQGYLALAMNAPRVDGLTPPQSTNALKFQMHWQDRALASNPAQKLEATLWAGPELHIEGRAMLDAAFAGGGTLTLPDAWSTPPLLILAGGTHDDLDAMLRWFSKTLPEDGTLALAFPGAADTVGRLWQTLATVCPAETAIVCRGIDFSGAIPVPEVGLVALRPTGGTMSEALSPFVSTPEAIRYAWGRREGWQLPLLGSEGTLCMTTVQPYWLFAAQERTMAALLDGLQGGRPADANLALRLDWRQLSGVLSEVLLRAARWELLPECNEADVCRDWLPLCEATGDLGQAAIDAQAWGGWLQFKGQLSRRSQP